MDDTSTARQVKSGHDGVPAAMTATTTTLYTPPQTKRLFGSCEVQGLDQNENDMP